ncbi:MAG: methionyl-tRNA formyltransferase [Legionellales bacterium]|nr:methionyl-tRNA formyltransferase [Legionellales bacterium]|tara:strand:- start:1014 stop:1979 length:966 start_codon:yes stop_codon:yes gene_type:complete
MNQINILFCATHAELALPSLAKIIESNHHIVAVVTAPDTRSGRGRKPAISPIKALAQQHSLTVLQPTSLSSDQEYERWKSLSFDLMIVAGYGLILPKRIILLPRYGCINVHPSLLPRWRGASPVQAAISNQDKTTGVSIIRLNEKMDAGDLILQQTLTLTGHEKTPELMASLADMGCHLLMQAIDLIIHERAVYKAQDDTQATYCTKLSKQDAVLDFNQTALALYAQIRALQPWPSSEVTLTDGTVMKIKSASFHPIHEDTAHSPGILIKTDRDQGMLIACGQDAIWLHTIQMPNKPMMPAYQAQLGYPKLFALKKRIISQ